MSTISLETNSGKALHPIGIGTWGFGGTWEAEYGREQEGVENIRYSISKGQNHIDGAQVYGAGHTDEVIGMAIEGLRREDLFITDKVWETNVATGLVRPAVEEMLKKLGTDYLDGLYIHKPWDDFPWREAVPQINGLIDEGVVRFFGVSNFNLEQIKETQKLSKHPIALNQIHFNLLHRENLDEATKAYCQENNIQVVAYKPLERGKVLDNPVVQTIAQEQGATPTQVALSWLISQSTLPIPQAPEKHYVDENVLAAEISLPPAALERLASIA